MSALGDPIRAPLDKEILVWMREAEWKRDDTRFRELALALFRHQFGHCAPYRRFCEARGVVPDTVSEWHEIPAVPAGAFKEVALRSFPKHLERATFRTSGTSSARRGELHLDTLALYEASLLATIRRFLFPDLPAGQRMRWVVLAASAADAPDSSLSYMFHHASRSLATRQSCFAIERGELDSESVVRALGEAERSGESIALCGTAFAFVNFLDATDATFALPEGTRIMETGGFKGRGREMSRAELYGWIGSRLGVGAERIVGQYGMTELGSQFYDSTLAEPEAPRRKLGPPWAQVRLIDPETGRDPEPGRPGLVTIHDLANAGSVAAVMTADLGAWVPATGEAGFDVLGRQPGAEERGCSIAADLMLAG